MPNRSNLVPATHQNSKRVNTRLGELRWLLQEVCFVTGSTVLLLQSSCVGPRPGPSSGGLPVPEPIASPAFLSADIAALFADVNGFTARVTIETSSDAVPNSMPPQAGKLFGQGGNLLFLPDAEGKRRSFPGAPTEGISFLWNSQSNAAFVLSEPLQGYAPVRVPADLGRANCERTLLGTRPAIKLLVRTPAIKSLSTRRK